MPRPVVHLRANAPVGTGGGPGLAAAKELARGRCLRLFDERSLAPGFPGLRFNPSIAEWRGGYLLAWRSGWVGSDVYLTGLSPTLDPGRTVRLDLACPAASTGREDPRLFWHAGKLHVSFIGVVSAPKFHTNQLYARLADDLRVERVYTPQYARRNPWEKNWSFFDGGGDRLYAVYSTGHRHRVVGVEGDRVSDAYETLWRCPWGGGEMRGGAAPVRVGGEWWSFFHDRLHVNGHLTYRCGLYAFEARPPFRPTRIVADPLLVADRETKPADQYCSVIFPGGATRRGDSWLVACGAHDRWTQFHEFSHPDLERRLVSVESARSWRWPCDESIREWVVEKDEYRLKGLDLAGGVCLDVGAHVGSFAEAARRRGADLVHCYEPDPDNFACLAANAESLGGVVAFPAAIGDGRPGGIVAGSDPLNTGGNRWEAGDGGIPSVPLDRAIGMAAGAAPSGRLALLKIDAEGAEFSAIATASRLDLVARVVGEYHGHTGDPGALRADLERAGFAVELAPTEDGRGLFFASRPAPPA